MLLRQMRLSSALSSSSEGSTHQGLFEMPDVGTGVMTGPELRALLLCSKYQTKDDISICYRSAMAASPTQRQMLTEEGAFSQDPSTSFSPQMAIASAAAAVGHASSYHSDGSTVNQDEWSACFDEASGSGPCPSFTRSVSSFPPFGISGVHPAQPFQRVRQMSPQQSIANAVGGGWGDASAWAMMTREAAGGEAAADEGGEESMEAQAEEGGADGGSGWVGGG